MDVNEVEIDIQKLNKSFNSLHVLKDVDIEIRRAETTVIIGGSGTGKSVLLKHIMGLLQPDSGRIIIRGVDVTTINSHEAEKLRNRFAMVFQSSALLHSLTVAENVGLGLKEQHRLPKKQINEIAMEKLKLVKMEQKYNSMPEELSGGMKKRVAIARALAMDPEVVLYDEPTSGLDPIMAGNIDELILELKEKFKMTSVVVTHDMESAFYIGDHICMLYQGRIIEEGDPESFKQSENKIVKQFITRHGGAGI
ncbi:MAG: ABC transporter ATP-binding protein [wastewater metagenome]|nr:ABC transporter ATP-binding protein [Candidatus Loosdrechtia aerotolerans]